MASSGEDPRQSITEAVSFWASKAFVLCQNAARLNLRGGVLHVRSSNLITSLDRIGRVLTNGFIIGTNVIYGIGWELGMKAHDIVPKPGRIGLHGRPAALRFSIGGAILYRRRVSMPAQAARPFLRPAIENNIPVLMNLLNIEIQKSLKKAFPGGPLNG